MNSFSCFWLMIAFITWNSNLVPLFAIVLIINMISNDFPLNFLRQQLVVTRSLMPQRTVAQNSILSHLIRSDTSNPMNKFRTYPTRLFWAICTITPALKTWSRGGSGDLASRSGLCETSIGDSGLIWWCVQRRRRCFRLHISAKAAGAQEVRLCFQRRGFVAVVAFGPLNLDANRTTSFSLAWTLLLMHVCNALFSMIGKLTQNIGSMALKYIPQIFGPEPFVWRARYCD